MYVPLKAFHQIRIAFSIGSVNEKNGDWIDILNVGKAACASEYHGFRYSNGAESSKHEVEGMRGKIPALVRKRQVHSRCCLRKCREHMTEFKEGRMQPEFNAVIAVWICRKNEGFCRQRPQFLFILPILNNPWRENHAPSMPRKSCRRRISRYSL